MAKLIQVYIRYCCTFNTVKYKQAEMLNYLNMKSTVTPKVDEENVGWRTALHKMC